MSRIIHGLEILDGDLDRGDASEIVDYFAKIASVPKHAKKLRGNIVFEFGRFDRDPRPNFVIPEVRRFAQLIDAAHPYFCYFLPELAETTQVYSWIMSLAPPLEPIAPDATGLRVNVGALVDLLVARIHAVRQFCDSILDNPTITETAIRDAFPAYAPLVGARLAARNSP